MQNSSWFYQFSSNLLQIQIKCALLLAVATAEGWFEIESEDFAISDNIGNEILTAWCAEHMILSAISTTTSILLVVGICTYNYKFIYPTLVWIPTNFLIETLSFVVFVLFDFTDADPTVLIDIIVALTISSLCWLCVHSYWRQVNI